MLQKTKKKFAHSTQKKKINILACISYKKESAIHSLIGRAVNWWKFNGCVEESYAGRYIKPPQHTYS